VEFCPISTVQGLHCARTVGGRFCATGAAGGGGGGGGGGGRGGRGGGGPQGEAAPPGEYRVTMTVNGKSYTSRLSVRQDPLLGGTQ